MEGACRSTMRTFIFGGSSGMGTLRLELMWNGEVKLIRVPALVVDPG
jgi:hypothetical protein